MTAILIDASLRGTVVLAAAWMIAGVLHRASADLRYRVWLAALVTTALFLIPMPVPEPFRIEIVTGPSGAANVSMAAPWNWPRNWPALIVLVWATGTTLLLARLGIGLVRLAELTHRARPAHTDGVLVTDGVTTPMTWGALRPVILLPAYVADWPAEKRAAVILHERAHIERRDWMWHIFAQMVTAVFWFHPLVWLAATRLRDEAERAADDRVLARGIQAADYAGRLVEVARQVRQNSVLCESPANAAIANAGVAMVRQPILTARIGAILDPARSRTRAGWRLQTMIAMASLCLLLSLEAAQSQRIYKIGEGVTAPTVASKAEPKYTKEARAAKIEGKVVLKMIIKSNGRADQIHVAQSLDQGLDANAVKAIQKWHFNPGKKDGKPVSVAATIEVNFKLL